MASVEDWLEKISKGFAIAVFAGLGATLPAADPLFINLSFRPLLPADRSPPVEEVEWLMVYPIASVELPTLNPKSDMVGRKSATEGIKTRAMTDRPVELMNKSAELPRPPGPPAPGGLTVETRTTSPNDSLDPVDETRGPLQP